MLRPRNLEQQLVMEQRYHLQPPVEMTEFTDRYGNYCQRLVAPAGQFLIDTSAIVDVPDEPALQRSGGFIEIPDLPDELLHYLLPSRYCESEVFGQMAMQICAAQPPGYDQVAAITQWIRTHIDYQPGSSDAPISAVEVNQRQVGVCRDLAHIGIALCRSLCIPARLVVGYLHQLEPMDLHAWFEVYVGDRWHTFDATQQVPRAGYVVIGYGRDAADVAIANQFGPGVYPLTQVVQVQQIESASG
jgi:transglutaminase-like putative cysteine protease